MTPPSAFSPGQFARALLDPLAPPPRDFAERRFAAYRNNVLVGVTDALAERFPVVLRLVGDEFFRATAGVHARTAPPRTPMLAEYGAGFPAFIEDFEPARELPYLAALVRGRDRRDKATQHLNEWRTKMSSIARLLLPYAIVGFFLRIVAAHPFFLSGQTKVDGPTIGGTIFGLDLSATLPTSLRDSAIQLFAQEYKLPFIAPEHAAYASAALENLLPILLVLGLATRLSALLLLIMALIIQIFVYPDAWWTVHAYWAAILLVLFSQGAGEFSLDYLFSRLFARRPEPRRAEAPFDSAQL